MVNTHNLKVGDIVVTRKGCRVKGPPGRLEVTDIDKMWLNFQAVVCKKPNGKKGLFLVQNLAKVPIHTKWQKRND